MQSDHLIMLYSDILRYLLNLASTTTSVRKHPQHVVEVLQLFRCLQLCTGDLYVDKMAHGLRCTKLLCHRPAAASQKAAKLVRCIPARHMI